jgi:hypothetical protein
MFIGPSPADMLMDKEIFSLFQDASGLGCNVSKCQVVAMRCELGQVDQAVQVFPCQAVDFPIRYLGMPLSVTKLPKSTLQPLLDNMADRLSAWRGKLMHRSG